MANLRSACILFKDVTIGASAGGAAGYAFAEVHHVGGDYNTIINGPMTLICTLGGVVVGGAVGLFVGALEL